MSSKIRELTNLDDFKKVYKVFSGPPYNEKYTKERVNGQVETMQNIFLEIDLDYLNRESLKQGMKKANPSIDKEKGIGD